MLGAGGWGAVFLGMDIDTGNQVALPVQLPANPYEREAMAKEVQTLDSLGRLVTQTEDLVGQIVDVRLLPGGQDAFSSFGVISVKEMACLGLDTFHHLGNMYLKFIFLWPLFYLLWPIFHLIAFSWNGLHLFIPKT